MMLLSSPGPTSIDCWMESRMGFVMACLCHLSCLSCLSCLFCLSRLSFLCPVVGLVRDAHQESNGAVARVVGTWSSAFQSLLVASLVRKSTKTADHDEMNSTSDQPPSNHRLSVPATSDLGSSPGVIPPKDWILC